MAEGIGKELAVEYQELANRRSNFANHWQELAQYLVPHKSDFTTWRSQGTKRQANVMNGSPLRALDRFAAGVHGLLTPKGQPWFSFGTVDTDLMERRAVRLWLQEVERRTRMYMVREEVDFHGAAQELYQDLGAFGTGAVFVGEKLGRGPSYQSVFLGECLVGTDDEGRVISMFRDFTMTVRQLARKFRKVPEAVSKKLHTNPHEPMNVVHAVRPREDWRPGRFGFLNMPWSSHYVLRDSWEVLDEGGFPYFPYIFPRWSRNSREDYGRGPGMKALPDVKTLNEFEKVNLGGWQKFINPPFMSPTDGTIHRLNLAPGAVNYKRSGTMGKPEPLLSGARPDIGEAKIAALENAIEKHFFLDVIEFPDPVTPDGSVQHMSATEAAIRQRQELKVLGPVMSRLGGEWLSPVVTISFQLLFQAGAYPPIPEELAGQELELSFIGPLAVALEATDAGSISEGVAIIQPLAQLDPTAIQRLHPDRAVEAIFRSLRIPERVLRTDDELAALRSAQAQAAQAGDLNQQAVQQSVAAKNLAAALSNVQ